MARLETRSPWRLSPWSVGVMLACLANLVCPDDLAAQDRGGEIRVGLYENAPKVFADEQGRPAGIFVDVIEYIAAQRGWSLRYVPGTWAQGLERLERGEIDLMPDVAYTAQRGARLAFHKVPVLSSWFQVYAPQNSDIRSIVDLREKRIAVLEGSVQEEALQNLAGSFGVSTRLVRAPSFGQAFAAVVKGKADAAVANQFYGTRHAKALGLEDTAIIFHPSDLFFAAPKSGRQALLAAVDSHLLELKKDTGSAYYQSLKKWTSHEVEFELPTWLMVLGQVSGLLLALLIIGSLILKRQVSSRTRELERKTQKIHALNEELRAHAATLEQHVAERTAELVTARNQAQSADRLKSAFLASMSHELRTPLNSIIGFSGILHQELAGPLNPEQKKQLGMVRSSAEHLLSLINDILDLSKIEAGQVRISVEDLDLRLSVEKIMGIMKPLAEKKSLALEARLAESSIPLLSDQRRVEQVLLNLLSNAVKFTERGTVTVDVQKKIDRVVVSVIDTGPGIAPEDLEKLFRPFSQVDTGLARKYEGTGLGLSICKRLVEMLGGKINVESRPGLGSTFAFELPIPGGEK